MKKPDRAFPAVLDAVGAWLASMTGFVRATKPVMGLRPPLLLHVSDTPLSTFAAVAALVRRLKPAVLVHTGDLVDDVKLGLNPAFIERHRAGLRRLADILGPAIAETGARFVIVLGNHDDVASVREFVPFAECYDTPVRLDLYGLDCGLAHEAADADATDAAFRLFGHDLSRAAGGKGLNGIVAVNVVECATGRVERLRYPAGTDAERTGRRKFGL